MLIARAPSQSRADTVARRDLGPASPDCAAGHNGNQFWRRGRAFPGRVVSRSASSQVEGPHPCRWTNLWIHQFTSGVPRSHRDTPGRRRRDTPVDGIRRTQPHRLPTSAFPPRRPASAGVCCAGATARCIPGSTDRFAARCWA